MTDSSHSESDGSGEETWDELELAYQRALAALDSLEAADPTLAGAEQPQGASTSSDHPATQVSTGSFAANERTTEIGPSARVTPRQIFEAVLFVGGQPLTSRKLAALLREEFDADYVDRTIGELNAQYADEERPYEIRLGEGGYRMELRPEFARVRNRAFGLAPKEVRLSQEALEILALVAYRQPVTRQQIEDAGKENPGGVLNQLLRRELIVLERTGRDGKQVAYRTTPRFLQVFGLGNLDDLPRADELSFK